MDALVVLALEKRYDTITIRDITERANISYSTFFRHFHEKDELLSELLLSVVDELVQLVNHNPDKSKETEGLLIFRHVAENQAFFRVLFSSQGTNRVLQDLQAKIASDLLATFVFKPNQAVPPEIVANHFVVGVMALIRWWLEHDMPYSVEQMSVIYSHLIAAQLYNYILPIDPPPNRVQTYG